MNDIDKALSMLKDMLEKHIMTLNEYSDSWDHGYSAALNDAIDKLYNIKDGFI